MMIGQCEPPSVKSHSFQSNSLSQIAPRPVNLIAPSQMHRDKYLRAQSHRTVPSQTTQSNHTAPKGVSHGRKALTLLPFLIEYKR